MRHGPGPLTRLVTGSPGALITLVLLLGAAAVVPVLNMALPPGSPYHVPTYLVSLWASTCAMGCWHSASI